MRSHWCENDFNYDEINLIFTTKVSHLASFWNWEFLELGNGQFNFLLIIPQLFIQWLHSLFVESWKWGQRLKFWGTYFPTRLVEFYTATAVHSNCSRNISIHSKKISLLSSKGNKISGICDYPYHLSGNSLKLWFSPANQHGYGVRTHDTHGERTCIFQLRQFVMFFSLHFFYWIFVLA